MQNCNNSSTAAKVFACLESAVASLAFALARKSSDEEEYMESQMMAMVLVMMTTAMMVMAMLGIAVDWMNCLWLPRLRSSVSHI